MEKYEIIEHTADIRIRVFGKNIEELFENSAIALFNLLTDTKSKPTNLQQINLEATRLDDLLIMWLNELISLFFTYKFIPANYSISIFKNKLKAEIKGEFFKKINIKTEIKAATYHNLEIKKIDSGFKTDIIFDV